MKSILLVTLLFPAFVFAAKQKSEGQVNFQSEQNGKAVKATVKTGFHFNAESPAFVKSTSGTARADAKSRSEKEILFELPESKDGSYELRFYVCDDAKTVCEMHRHPWGKSALKTAQAKTESKNDDLQAAFDQAKKQNKLVFIDFAADWCPPCIRLEHEVFPTKEFKKASQKYVVVRVNVDKPENEKWMETYSIKAFPTLVVTNAEGEEVGRRLDYQTTASLSNFLTTLAKQTPLTQSQLKAKAEAGDKAAQEALAISYLDSLNYSGATLWFDKADSKSYRRAEARVYFWEEQLAEAKTEADKVKASDNLETAQRESVAKFPDVMQAIGWQKGLAESLIEDGSKDQGKIEMEKAKAMAMKWIQDPGYLKKNRPSELGDLTLPEVWSMVGEMEEKLGNNDAKKTAQENAVKETLKLKPTVKTPTHVIYLVAYMKPVRELSEIEPWLLKLQEAYPQEFTYYQRHAKLLLDKGEPLRARPIAEKAYSLAFGSNQLTIGLLLAKIHKELQNKQELQSLLAELKSQPYFSTQRNKNAAKSINEFEATLKK